MYCGNCGKMIPDSSNFCHYCGAKAMPVQKPSPSVNNNAGNVNYNSGSTVNASPAQRTSAPAAKKRVKAGKKGGWKKFVALLVCALLFVAFYSELTLPEMIEAIKLGEPLTHRAMYKLEDILSEKKTSYTIYKREWDTEICPWAQAEDYLMEYIQGNPELFFVDIRNTEFLYVEGDESPYYTIKLAYFDELTDEASAQRMQAVADRFINAIPAGSSDWEKALYLHDALVRHVTYTECETDQTAYAALVDGKAVCMGYAMAYEYLLNRAGVECDTVVGYADEFSAAFDGSLLQDDQHAWSIVTFREGGTEKSYFVDTTWDDLGLTDDYAEEYISHRWFCVTLDDIRKEGRVVVDEIYDLSKWNFSDNTLNYYVYTDAFIESYDFDDVAEIFYKQKLEGKNQLSLRVADLEVYYDLKYDMQDNGGLQRLLDILDEETFNYNFTYDYSGNGLICFDIYLGYPEE